MADPSSPITALIERARSAMGELRDAAREGRVIEFRQRDALVMSIVGALDKLSELSALLREPAREPITADTSDGYHTFRELYAYRKAYNAALFNEWAAQGKYDVHKSWRHSDGEPCFGGGWFIVMAETPFGQVSNHYETEDWSLFRVPERERGNVYDGHTPQMALERLLKLAGSGDESSSRRLTGVDRIARERETHMPRI